MSDHPHPHPISPEAVRKIARLARLAITDQQVETYRTQLSSVLGYIDRLRQLDLTGVEPMANVGDFNNRFGDDIPGPTISNATLMKMAPDGGLEPFIKVPKVLEEGGGA